MCLVLIKCSSCSGFPKTLSKHKHAVSYPLHRWGRSTESHWASLWELHRADKASAFHKIKSSPLQLALRDCVWLKAGHKSLLHEKRGETTASLVQKVKALGSTESVADYGFRDRSALLSACTLPLTELQSEAAPPDAGHPGMSSVAADATTLALALSRAVVLGVSSDDLKKKLLLQPDTSGLSPLLAVLASGSTKLAREHISHVRALDMDESERHGWLTHRTVDKISPMHAVLMSGNKGNFERLLFEAAQARLPKNAVWDLLTGKMGSGGVTPLHTAAGCSSAATLARLLQELRTAAPSHDAYAEVVGAQTIDGYTCLHHVLARGELDAAAILMDALQNSTFDADWQREALVHMAANDGLTPTDAAAIGGPEMLDFFRDTWYRLLAVKPHVRSMEEHRLGLIQVLANADKDSAFERVRALQLNALPLGHRQELLCDGTVLHAALLHKHGKLADAIAFITFATVEEVAAANANHTGTSSARDLMKMLRSCVSTSSKSSVDSADLSSPPLLHLLCTKDNLIRRTQKAVAAAGVSQRSITEDVLLKKCNKQTGRTPFAYAVATGSAQSVVALRGWAGTWPSSVEERGELVRICCKRNDAEGLLVADYVLSQVAGSLTPREAGLRSADGYAPLHNILRHGTDKMLEAFLTFGDEPQRGEYSRNRSTKRGFQYRTPQTMWDVLTQDAFGMSPLHYAIDRGASATALILSALVDHSEWHGGSAKLWNVLTEPDHGESKMPPLIRAFRQPSTATVPVLLDTVDSLDDQDHFGLESLLLSSCAEGYTPLHSALRSGDATLLKRVLWLKHSVSMTTVVDDEAFLTRKARNGMSPLHFALASGDVECIGRYLALLLEAEKLDVNVYYNLLTRSAAGRLTPLIAVLTSGSSAALKLYLHTLEEAAMPPEMLDACLTTSTRGGKSPLMVVFEKGDQSSFDLLWAALSAFSLKREAKRDMLVLGDVRGWTPLHCALKRPSSKAVLDGFFVALHTEALCDADVKRTLLHQTSDRWTPLHQAAASSCSLLVVQALVAEIRSFGDDILLTNLNMQTRQGHVPSRPTTQLGAAEVNAFLAGVKAEVEASVCVQSGNEPQPFFQ